jgi:hypothetical protein
MERVCVEAGLNPHNYQYTEYTVPFNKENFDALYSQRKLNDSSSVSLTIWLEGSSDKPRQVSNIEQFKGEFDPLWQELTTPKFKLDRSYKDSLEGSHIG